MIEFAFSAAAVIFCATRLSCHADALERNTPISGVWIGAIFLAIVTSLPEAVTTIGSAIMENALNLGAANLFGSNTFNLAILVVLDIYQGHGPLLLGVRSGLIVAAAGGICMMALTSMAIAFHAHPAAGGVEHWVGPLFSIGIVLAYALLSNLTTRELPIHDSSEAAAPCAAATKATGPNSRVTPIVVRLVAFSVLLVIVAIWLLRICDQLAVMPLAVAGHSIILGRTVTGTFLLSAATSFPELFVCMAALRLGQTNMAVANLLGSNMVNMLFIPIMHVASRHVTFYSLIDAPSILVLSGVAIIMSIIFMLGLLARSRRSFLFLGWEVIGMLLTYLAGAALVLRMGIAR